MGYNPALIGRGDNLAYMANTPTLRVRIKPGGDWQKKILLTPILLHSPHIKQAMDCLMPLFIFNMIHRILLYWDYSFSSKVIIKNTFRAHTIKPLIFMLKRVLHKQISVSDSSCMIFQDCMDILSRLSNFVESQASMFLSKGFTFLCNIFIKNLVCQEIARLRHKF